MSGERKPRLCEGCGLPFAMTFITQRFCTQKCVDGRITDLKQQAMLLVVADGCPHSIGTGDVCDPCRRLLGPAVRT